jgi:hypothetical protein
MSAPSEEEMALLDKAAPIDVMKFTLTYEGLLRSNKSSQVWSIRRAFHPQLVELWRETRALRQVANARVPEKGTSYLSMELHHSAQAAEGQLLFPLDDVMSDEHGNAYRYLSAPIIRHGKRYIPLVRESLGLLCSLHILFLRKEEPGALVKQGGDLDNRIKTLFDGLRMPANGDPANAGELEDPFLTLLEDDSLISGFTVETGRLLTRPDGEPAEVKLIVTVTVKAAHVRAYNLPLLGD